MRDFLLAGWLFCAALAAAWPAPGLAQYATPVPSIVAPEFTIEQGVSDPLLAAGALVEFTVRVSNAGSGVADPGVVTISLSPELIMPEGMAAVASQGVYDAVGGRWEIGWLQPGSEAVLVIPAQVTSDPLTPCAFSLAELWPQGPGDNAQSLRAFATLRAPGVERCVDLVAGAPGDPARGIFSCDDQVTVRVPIANLGPDTARDVTVAIAQDPALLPGLVFTDSRCETPGRATCRLPLLAPTSLAWGTMLELGSAAYRNSAATQVTLVASVWSADLDLEPGNEETGRLLTVNAPSLCPEFDEGWGAMSVSPCFVATAAWGSPLHPHVRSLRRFRDGFLVTNAPGRAFVALYYSLSPPLARYIAARPRMRALARAALWPLVFAVERPWWCLVLVISLVSGTRHMRGRLKRRR
jgi:hypothetical protein